MRPYTLAVAMVLADIGVAIWHRRASWRYRVPPDAVTRQRLYRLAWEVRGLTVVVTAPAVAAVLVGRLPLAYLPSVVLIQVAGFLVADMVAPAGLDWRR
jgi:hypothetical protein